MTISRNADSEKKDLQNQLAQAYRDVLARQIAKHNRDIFSQGALFENIKTRLECFVEDYLSGDEQLQAETLTEAKRIYELAEVLAKRYNCVHKLQPYFDAYEQLRKLARGEVQ
jgi:predicted component of type VI protein secretion system